MEYPFVNHIKYLGVIFDKRIAWRLHIEMTEAKALRTFIRIFSLFEREHLSFNIKLTLHKALITSVITYAYPTWEFAADTYILKSQCLKNRFSETLEMFQCTLVHDSHPSICIQLYKKLCR
jgi:hypothetical protein